MRTAFLVTILLALAGVSHAADAPYDLVFRNARIVDGTGSPWFRGNLAIGGDTIVRIAPSIPAPASLRQITGSSSGQKFAWM